MSRKLFTAAPSNKWLRNAVAGGEYSTPYAYILGYYEAAETLAMAALRGGTQDTLFFPICFNYRHYVELSLKHLIIATEKFYVVLEELGDTRGTLRESAQSEIINDHSLERLFRLLVERLQLVTDEKFDDTIRKTIMQLHGMDPDGQNFRYPRRTDDRLALPEQSAYDLEIIRRRMEEVYNYLSGLDIWLSENTSLALELLHEWQQQMPDFLLG
jgi:hypothetical protein